MQAARGTLVGFAVYTIGLCRFAPKLKAFSRRNEPCCRDPERKRRTCSLSQSFPVFDKWLGAVTLPLLESNKKTATPIKNAPAKKPVRLLVIDRA
jgi:hypothetical protein